MFKTSVDNGIVKKKYNRLLAFIYNQSIFNKTFFGIIAIVLLIISITSVISLIYLHQAHEKEAMNNAERLVNNINLDFQDNLDQVQRIIMSIYADTSGMDSNITMQDVISTAEYADIEDEYKALKVTRDFFQRLIFLRKDFNSIYIYVSKNKSFSFSVNGSNKLNYDPTNEAWFKQTLEAKGKTIISAPHIPYQLDYTQKVLSFSTCLKGTAQGKGGPEVVVLIDFTLATINNIVDKVNLGKKIGVIFLDEYGKSIYSNNTDYTEIDLDNDAVNKVTEEDDGKFTTYIAGMKYLVVFNTSEITGWKLLTLTPYTEVEKDDHKVMFFYILIMMAALLITILISYGFSKIIFKPIKSLRKGMVKVQEGDFDFQLEKTSNDELGQLVISFNVMTVTIKELIVEKYEEKLARNNAEFRYLQAQINPHFIYNVLQTISSLAVVKEVPEISRISKGLAKMLRYSLNNRRKVISIKEEMDNLLSYLDIQKVRFKDFLNYEISVEEDLYSYEIVKLVLQPIVENSITHGIEPKGENGLIKITAGIVEGNIEIQILDNGAGLTEEEVENLMRDISSSDENELLNQPSGENNNIGLKNINLRVKLIYGQEYGLFIESLKGQWTSVKVRIPAKSFKKEEHDD